MIDELFMDAIHERKHTKVVETSPSSEDTARWTIPTTPNTTIPNSDLKTAIRRRVGLNLQVLGICKCGKSVSATGPHILTCTHGVGNHFKAQPGKHLLLNFSRRAGYSVQDEPTLLYDLATSKKGKRRRFDIPRIPRR
jgi:hypothetical protein